MNVERLVLGALETNCWIVDDGDGGPLVVIDPAGDAEALIQRIAGRTVGPIVLTHGHFDHLGAVRTLLSECHGTLMIHSADAGSITTPEGAGATVFGFNDYSPPADRVFEDGDLIQAGSVFLEVIHTPGHTPGSVCLLGEGVLFSGDTLFAGTVGRTDLNRGDGRALALSVAQRLAPLPDATVVCPGHGPNTTIGRERRVNPFFPRA